MQRGKKIYFDCSYVVNVNYYVNNSLKPPNFVIYMNVNLGFSRVLFFFLHCVDININN